MNNSSQLARWVVVALTSFASSLSAAQTGSSDINIAAQAEALARNGNTVQAESIARAYLADHPDSVPVQVVMGELESYRHRWPEAMTCFEAALHRDGGNQPARQGEEAASLSFALHEHNAGNEEAALAVLQRAITFLPDDAKLQLSLAVQAQRMHRLKTALAAVNTALAVTPQDARALYVAAGIHFDRGESSVAAEQYRRYLQQQPNDASAHFGLGRALRALQQTPEAKRELERSIALQPVQTEAYYQLGELDLNSGEDDAARRNYLKVLDRMPAHAGALTGLGMLDFRSQQYESARSYLDRAILAAPDYQPAHYYRGLTLRKLGDMARAEEDLRVAVELANKQQGKGKPVGPQ